MALPLQMLSKKHPQSSGGGGTPAFEQYVHVLTGNTTITFTNAIKAGDVIVVSLQDFNGSTLDAPSSSNGNTYKLAATTTYNSGNSAVATYVATNCNAGTETITSSYLDLAAEYSGVKTVAYSTAVIYTTPGSDANNLFINVTNTSAAILHGFMIDHGGSTPTITYNSTPPTNITPAGAFAQEGYWIISNAATAQLHGVTTLNASLSAMWVVLLQ